MCLFCDIVLLYYAFNNELVGVDFIRAFSSDGYYLAHNIFYSLGLHGRSELALNGLPFCTIVLLYIFSCTFIPLYNKYLYYYYY